MPHFTFPAVLINHNMFSDHLIPCNNSSDHTIPLPFMISANSMYDLSLMTCVFIRLRKHISPFSSSFSLECSLKPFFSFPLIFFCVWGSLTGRGERRWTTRAACQHPSLVKVDIEAGHIITVLS